MDYKKLKNILLLYRSESYVKHLLASGERSGKPNKDRKRPSRDFALFLEDKYKIPVRAWINIRDWLAEQQTKPAKKAKK